MVTHLAVGQVSHLQWSEDRSGLTIETTTPASLEFRFTLSGMHLEHLVAGDTGFNRIIIEGFTHDSKIGDPELPVYQQLIELPGDGRSVIEIVTRERRHIDLNQQGFQAPLFPAQPPLLKKNKEQDIPMRMNRGIYSKDTLLENSAIRIKPLGTMRGKKIGLLSISPVAYNPRKNSLEILTRLAGRIEFSVPDQQAMKNPYESHSFDAIFKSLLNQPVKSVGSSRPEKLVILADTMFREALKPFVAWKTLKGFEVIEVYKGENGVGTTALEMRDYLAEMYHSATEEDPAFTYLLLVGDHEQIPAFQPSHYSDLYYAEYDGNGDFLPDVLYGRFSAREPLELIPQIEKTLEYEQYAFPDPSFLNRAVMIAGVDGTFASKWGNGHINYATGYYINTDHGILSHTYLYPESGSSDAQIIQDISNGVGFVNYTGHGEWDRWLDPTFHLNDIPALQNHGMYPLMIGNGCVTTTFSSYGECLGEAVLRAENKGALGYIGCSNDSYWDEDYWWAVGVGPITASPTYNETGLGMYDRSFHEFGETPEEWAASQAQIMFAGNMAVMEGSISKARYYWEIYHLLGDPSLMVYFSEAEEIMASFPDTLPTGSDRLQIMTHPNIYAGLTAQGELLAAGHSNSTGFIDLNFSRQDSEGEMVLVLTGQNYKPLVTTIHLASIDQAYVSLDSTSINDQSGNGNGRLDYGETIVLDIGLKNLGQQDADVLQTTLRTTDPFLSIIDSTHAWGTLESQAERLEQGVFAIQVADSIPDQWPVTMEMEITCANSDPHSDFFQFVLNAPVPESGRIRVRDHILGNGNARMEPGETVEIVIEAMNTGQSPADSVFGKLSSGNACLELLTDSSYIGCILPGETANARFIIKADSLTPAGTAIPIYFVLEMPPYESRSTYTLYPGLVYEDFELGNYASLAWQHDPEYPWLITDGFAWDGQFSAQSAAIQNNQSSELRIDLYLPEADTVSFYRKVSSEYNYDFLRFYIDDDPLEKWSGTLDWENVSFLIPAGAHTLRWIYTKDVSVSNGFDRGWIDFIRFPDRSFLRKNTAVLNIAAPVSDVMLTDQEWLTIEIQNFGTDTVRTLPVGALINGISLPADTVRATLLPGSDHLFTFTTPIDLSTPGSYELQVFTSLEGDEIPANDTLQAAVIHYVADAAMLRIIQPGSDQEYSGQETIAVVVKNEGTYPLSEIQAGYRVNDLNEVLETIPTDSILKPGDTLVYSFHTTADMASFGSYIIKAFSRIPYDAAMANDTATATFEHINTTIGNPSGSSHVLVYPNPFNDRVHLVFPADLETVVITLIDPAGRTRFIRQFERILKDQVMEIQAHHLSPGPYIILIHHAGARQRIRILKE
jgi:hypothetical protein